MIPEGNEVNANEVQPLNALGLMLVIPEGNEVNVIPVQPPNALAPMLVIPEGNEDNSNEVQLRNAPAPMLVIPDSPDIVVRAVQPWNAKDFITVTEAGRVTDASEVHPLNALLPTEVILSLITHPVTPVRLTVEESYNVKRP